MNQKEFDALSIDEKLNIVEERLGGDHSDRITSLSELFDLEGKTIYFVISPFGPSNKQNLGNAYVHEWMIGSIMDCNHNKISSPEQLKNYSTDSRFYFTHYEDNNKIMCINDLNIIPNNHNNSAAFKTKEAAEAYMVYRKLTWDIDSDIETISGEYDFWLTVDQIEKIQDAIEE